MNLLNIVVAVLMFVLLQGCSFGKNGKSVRAPEITLLKENLISKHAFYKATPDSDPLLCWQTWRSVGRDKWREIRNRYKVDNGVVSICGTKAQYASLSYQARKPDFQSEYILEFDAKKSGDGASWINIFVFDKKRRKSKLIKNISLGNLIWKKEKIVFSIPKTATGEYIAISFYAKESGTVLSVKNASLYPAAEIKKSNSKIKLGDYEATGIYVFKHNNFYDVEAANILNSYFKKMTGDVLPIFTISGLNENNSKQLKGAIWLGRAALKAGAVSSDEINKVGKGGYLVKCDKEFLAIVGGTEPGAISGCYALLKRLGCKFLSRNEESIPWLGSIEIETGTFSKTPAFEVRIGLKRKRGNYQSLGYTNERWIANPRTIGFDGNEVHTADTLINYNKYNESHPEYFALIKGKRLKREKGRRFDVHLCMANKNVRNLAAKNLMAWISAMPESELFFVSQGDAHSWCECRNCQALDVEKGKVKTDRLLSFVNSIADEVAKKYPGKFVTTLAYTKATEPAPSKLKPADNVRVFYCPYPHNWDCHLHAFCDQNKVGMKTLEDWIKLCPEQLYIFDYPMCYAEPYSLFNSFYAMRDKIRYYAKHGIKGIYFCGMPKFFGATFETIISELLWDPSIDFDNAINRHMALYYGGASPYMREFFDLVWAQIQSQKLHHFCEGTNHNYVSDDFARKAYSLFARAEKAAKDDKVLERRIADQKLLLLFSDLNERNRINEKAKDFDEYAHKLGELMRLVKKRGISRIARRISTHEWLQRTALFKIKDIKDPKLQKLIENPVKTLKNSIPRVQQKIDGGWRIPGREFFGGEGPLVYSWKCPPKKSLILRRPWFAPKHKVFTYLFLDKAPCDDWVLEMEGQDNGKRNATLIKININEKEVFKGYTNYGGCKWSWKRFKVPFGCLRSGKNIITIENLTPEKPTKERVVKYIAKKDPYWGWFIISDLILRKRNDN